MRSFLLAGLIGLLLVNVAFSLNKQRDCKCRIQANRRIIGGRDAAQMGFPWSVSLSKKEGSQLPEHLRRLLPDSEKTQFHNCGASILNEYYILTAGHCVGSSWYTHEPEDWEIGFGDNDLAQIFNKRQYKPIEAFYQHPEFLDFFDTVNDVALIKLAEPLEFNDTVQPACLDFEERSIYEGALKISGWGSVVPVYVDMKTGEATKSVIARFLKEAEVYDFSQLPFCKQPEQNICVRNEETNDTACKGDSGGPIHHTKNGKSSIIGVASFVNGKEEDNKMKICAGNMAYTRLSRFKSWVEQHIGSNYCS